MQANLLEQGLELMYYGMGTVFVFLTLLVVSISLMSWLLRRFSGSAGASASIPVPVPSSADRKPVEHDSELFAVIGAAIHRYRSRHKQ